MNSLKLCDFNNIYCYQGNVAFHESRPKFRFEKIIFGKHPTLPAFALNDINKIIIIEVQRNMGTRGLAH